MSKWNQIQARLSEIEGGLFQQIGDAYLRSKRDFVRMNSRGSMIGADKTISGTPDTVFDLPNGKHVFTQYTTVDSSRLKRKLHDDLRECFDISSTAIPVANVEEVILCHNSRSDAISRTDKLELGQIAAQHGWRLSIVDVEELAWALWREYPRIAEDLLGIPIDTGQVLGLDEFVRQYDRSSSASPLAIEFGLREDELHKALDHLSTNDLLIITGPAGVGKTRLAIECCRRFVELNDSYQTRCIYFKGAAVHSDVTGEVSSPGNYLLMVDDVNRVHDWRTVIHLLSDRRVDRNVKLILTVRDYALTTIADFTKGFSHAEPFVIKPFSNEQIRKFLGTQLRILNPHAQDRIVEIAKGNARLAVMASHLALKQGTLNSIADTAGLYDEVFGSYWRDGHVLCDPQHLKVAGLVAMLRVINLADEQFMQQVIVVTGVSASEFSRSIHLLHDGEVVDLYEDEMVKVSDQVLATFLIYRVFFRDCLMNLATVLSIFFAHRPKTAGDRLYPVLNAFHSSATFEKVGEAIDQIWQHFNDEEDNVFNMLEAFWFARPARTLQYVAERIQSTVLLHMPVAELRFEDSSPSYGSDILLAILEAFRGSDLLDDLRIAVQILIDYGHRRNDRLTAIATILAKSFGFKFESYLQRYQQQSIVTEILVARIGEADDPIDVGLFLQVAKEYLKIEHSSGRMEGNTYVWRDFALNPLPSLLQLRSTIWRCLLPLVGHPTHQERAISILCDYTRQRVRPPHRQSLIDDAATLLPLLQRYLSSTSFLHCQIVNDYIEILDELGVEYDAAFHAQFMHPALELATTLSLEFPHRRGFSYEEYEQQIEERLRSFELQMDGSRWREFFEQCQEIMAISDSHQQYQIRDRVVRLFRLMAEDKPSEFVNALANYLVRGDELDLYPFGIIYKLIQVLGADDALTRIRMTHPDQLQKWLLAFYVNLPEFDIRPEHWMELQHLYGAAPVVAIPQRFDYISHFRGQNLDALVKITKILLDRAEQPQIAHILERLLPHDKESCSVVQEAFALYPVVFIEAYLFVLLHVQHADYAAVTFDLILDLDASFGAQYTRWCWIQQKNGQHVHPDRHDFTVLWRREDYDQVLDNVLRMVQELPELRYGDRYECFKAFFIPPNAEKRRDFVIEERIRQYLESLIVRCAHDAPLMACVFDIAAESLSNYRRQLLACFLDHNQDVEIFRSLSLFESAWTGWGSLEPVFEEKIEFLQSVLPLLGDYKLLAHRGVIEEQITYWRRRIDSERRRQFANDDW